MTGARRRLFLGCLVLAAVCAAPPPAVHATGRHRTRLDSQLRAVLDQSAPAAQRVIVRARPGARATVADSLKAHGDVIVAEHESLDAVTAIVHPGDLDELADSDFVLSVSSDAIVRPNGLLDGLLGLVVDVVKVVGNVLL